MQVVSSWEPDVIGSKAVRRAYDTVAEDYATHLPDTRAEAALDLAMIDAFADAVGSGGSAGTSRTEDVESPAWTCRRAWSRWLAVNVAT